MAALTLGRAKVERKNAAGAAVLVLCAVDPERSLAQASGAGPTAAEVHPPHALRLCTQCGQGGPESATDPGGLPGHSAAPAMARNKPPAVRLDMLEPHAQPAANPRDSRDAIEKIAVRTIYACTSGHLASEWCGLGAAAPLPIRRAVAAMTFMNTTHF